MEAKKSPKANLEDKKTFFIQIGLIVALAVVLFAFEWKSYEKLDSSLGQRAVDDTPEEIIPITKQEIKPPPPKPPPQTTILNIVDDDVEIDDEIEIDAEADDDTEMQEYIPDDDDEDEIAEMEIFTVVEDAPSFPGGDEARIKYLQNNIKYPQMARESGIQGTVYITFVVERDGKVTNVKILRGIGGGCDEEAIRVIEKMPKWHAGKQRGKPVRVQFNMPIKFTLQG